MISKLPDMTVKVKTGHSTRENFRRQFKETPYNDHQTERLDIDAIRARISSTVIS